MNDKNEKRVFEGPLIVLVRGAGEMASGVAHRLHRSHFRVCMLDIPMPLAVRREVSFCEAVYEGEKEVEGVRAITIGKPEAIQAIWEKQGIPLIVDPEGRRTRDFLKPDVLVDAILAKKNLGTRMADAPLVIGLGPGFSAGKGRSLVVETNRGHNLGKVIFEGMAEPDSGRPGEIGGFTTERVLRSPKAGVFHSRFSIGDPIEKGSIAAEVDGLPVIAEIGGMVRGMLREGTTVDKEMKVGDIDPRAKRDHCFSISEKARAIGGGVLEAILYWFNR